MIAPDVFSTKPRSGLSDQRNTCTGSAVAASVTPFGMSTMKATMPIMSSGAVSPSACAMPMMVPVMMPGILTGTIIGMARALGETAPLLMIGMVAFIVDVPHGIRDAATALPVQIFLWADSPERGFVEKTSGAIIVLLAFLVVMNTTAVILRKRFERRW